MGHAVNKNTSPASKTIKTSIKTVSNSIKKVLIITPVTIEKTTSPFLYSFLRGTKKVLSIRGNEKNSRAA